MQMNSGSQETRGARGYVFLFIFAVAVLALSVAAQQSTTSLALNGQNGSAKVVQVNGHNYVDVEGLARLANGSISFKGQQIVLTLPGGSASAAPAATQPPQGFSKAFLTSAIEAMTRVREWHAALRTAIERGVPLATGWLDNYQAAAQNGLNLASVAISTDSDRNAYPFMVTEYNNMKALSDKYVNMNKALQYIDPTSLQTDPLNQQLLACGHSLASMATSDQFVNDGSCQ
ncbi:MAG TPA: hypothetical protein VMH20_13440 [Verrucomicrobiae bacterium]|nr:hypothetical protein [Verrucomicrobiae bacterium]